MSEKICRKIEKNAYKSAKGNYTFGMKKNTGNWRYLIGFTGLLKMVVSDVSSKKAKPLIVMSKTTAPIMASPIRIRNV